MIWLQSLAILALAAWLWLLLARRGFWRALPRIEQMRDPPPAVWPAVAAVVPARDEAALVERTLRSLLAQDYAGELAIVLVDDHSADGTAAIAQRLARAAARPLEVVAAPPLPPGWSGKLWALTRGLEHAGQLAPRADHVLLTDADVAHARDSLARLLARAEARRLDLVSLMVRLRCESLWERLLVPPFVFFFQLLYPFGAVSDPGSPVAAAAGGCMLVRRQALRAAGGVAAIRGELIDDVALARAIKRRPGGGRIWLGLTTTSTSLRPYRALGEIWVMVARTADVQLRHSLPLLGLAMLGLTLAFILPPLALAVGVLAGEVLVAGAGALALCGMALAFWPTVRLYRLGAGWALTLPLAAALFGAMTLDSAWRFRRGAGGRWKGRLMTPES
jgi:hopene-associated glycosyltransferase HpnB